MEHDDIELHMTSHGPGASYYKFAPINAQMKKIIQDKADQLNYDNGTIGLTKARKEAYDKQHPNQTAGYRAAQEDAKMETIYAAATDKYEKETSGMTQA